MATTVRPIMSKMVSVLRSTSHAGLVLHDVSGRKHPLHVDQRHLEETIGWLCRAQDASGCGGVSAGSFATDGGWLPPDRETTGYIIPTLIEYGEWGVARSDS